MVCVVHDGGPTARQNGMSNEGRSYGLAPAVESMNSSQGPGLSPPAAEVWLRGNVRPVLAAGVLAAVVSGVVLAGIGVAPVSSSMRWLVGGGAACLLAGVALLAYSASRPRLVCQGDRLQVRISPLSVADVPLDVVECFFAGSNPLDASGAPTCGEHAAFRVGTLVVRLAERAGEYRGRETFRPWVVWEDGYIIIDGRWCEPLPPAKARELGGTLMAAKRAAAGRSVAG